MRDEAHTRGTFTLIAAFIAGIALILAYAVRYIGAGIAAVIAYLLFRWARKL